MSWNIKLLWIKFFKNKNVLICDNYAVVLRWMSKWVNVSSQLWWRIEIIWFSGLKWDALGDGILLGIHYAWVQCSEKQGTGESSP